MQFTDFVLKEIDSYHHSLCRVVSEDNVDFFKTILATAITDPDKYFGLYTSWSKSLNVKWLEWKTKFSSESEVIHIYGNKLKQCEAFINLMKDIIYQPTPISTLSDDVLLHIFSLFTLRELAPVAQVCHRWNELTLVSPKKKAEFNYLMKSKITSTTGSRPSPKQCNFMLPMLQTSHVTSRMVSKFITGGADTACLIRIISMAESLTWEQIVDALDNKCSPKLIIKAILNKMADVPDQAMIAVIKKEDLEVFSLFLEKSSYNLLVLMSKCLSMEKYKCVKHLITIYPEIEISIEDVISSTDSIYLSPEDFQIILNQYLKNKNRTIPFAAVERIARIIDTRLSIQYAPHNERTEKIYEVIAKTFVMTNKIKTFEQNDELLLFIRTHNKHSLMINKLSQAIALYNALCN